MNKVKRFASRRTWTLALGANWKTSGIHPGELMHRGRQPFTLTSTPTAYWSPLKCRQARGERVSLVAVSSLEPSFREATLPPSKNHLSKILSHLWKALQDFEALFIQRRGSCRCDSLYHSLRTRFVRKDSNLALIFKKFMCYCFSHLVLLFTAKLNVSRHTGFPPIEITVNKCSAFLAH